MRNRTVWLTLFAFAIAGAGIASANHLCIDEAGKGIVNGEYVQKNN